MGCPPPPPTPAALRRAKPPPTPTPSYGMCMGCYRTVWTVPHVCRVRSAFDSRGERVGATIGRVMRWLGREVLCLPLR